MNIWLNYLLKVKNLRGKIYQRKKQKLKWRIQQDFKITGLTSKTEKERLGKAAKPDFSEIESPENRRSENQMYEDSC